MNSVTYPYPIPGEAAAVIVRSFLTGHTLIELMQRNPGDGGAMKKKITVLLACVFGAFVLCFALVGCSGGGGDTADSSSTGTSTGTTETAESTTDLLGHWDLVGVTEGGTSVTAEEAGITASLTISEDNTAVVMQDSNSLSATWEYSKPTLTVSADGDDLVLTLKNGKLTTESDGTTLIFARTLDNDGNMVDTLTYPATVVDDAEYSIVLTARYTDSFGDVGYNVTLTNKTATAVTFKAESDTFTAGGNYTTATLYKDVAAGETVDTILYFPKADFPNGDEGLINVTGDIMITNTATGEYLTYYNVGAALMQ